MFYHLPSSVLFRVRGNYTGAWNLAGQAIWRPSWRLTPTGSPLPLSTKPQGRELYKVALWHFSNEMNSKWAKWDRFYTMKKHRGPQSKSLLTKGPALHRMPRVLCFKQLGKTRSGEVRKIPLGDAGRGFGNDEDEYKEFEWKYFIKSALKKKVSTI